jgi:hypothetical protein
MFLPFGNRARVCLLIFSVRKKLGQLEFVKVVGNATRISIA